MAAVPKPVSQFLDLRLDDLRTAPEGIAQRPFRRSRGEHLARTFNPAKFGIPVVNCVEGVFWVIDGQHRLYAYRRQPGVTGDTRVRCEVYDHLSQAEMADVFLGRNDTLNVTSFDRFYVACAAGYKRECAVRAVLDKLDLRVSRSPGSGSISAVGAMLRVKRPCGRRVLRARAARVARRLRRRSRGVLPRCSRGRCPRPRPARRGGRRPARRGPGQVSQRLPWPLPACRHLSRAARPALAALRCGGRRRRLQQEPEEGQPQAPTSGLVEGLTSPSALRPLEAQVLAVDGSAVRIARRRPDVPTEPPDSDRAVVAA